MSQPQKAQAPKAQTAITPTRAENYAEWYQQVVKAAELAEASDVRGCMVIKPWGYALWENIQRSLDRMFKDTGHRNAYFPLFIPLSFLEKEAEHVEGFAKECAVVTHHRLEPGKKADGRMGLVPAGELQEPLVVRPTSETIIGASFAKWVQSYRDLPLLINQWANVVRWEMRTRLFLRTTEFLWQEGHTAHATQAEAEEETAKILAVYTDFAENWMAMPVAFGTKTAAERFPGAVETYCIEAFMQDRKSLQAGTSHFLGQNFAKASDIKFLDQNSTLQHAWTTSWGVSTRLIGGMIRTHADDDGMVLPPRLAPAHIVILPVLRDPEKTAMVLEWCKALAKDLTQIDYYGRKIEVELDARDLSGGDKVWQWIKKGIPIRLEVGPRDIEKNSVFMARRDKPAKEKIGVERDAFIANIVTLLDEMQKAMYDKALAHRAEHTKTFTDEAAFRAFFTPSQPVVDNEAAEIHGGFAIAAYNGDAKLEARIKDELGVTVRCIPIEGSFGYDASPATCVFTGTPNARRVIWAKSY